MLPNNLQLTKYQRLISLPTNYNKQTLYGGVKKKCAREKESKSQRNLHPSQLRMSQVKCPKTQTQYIYGPQSLHAVLLKILHSVLHRRETEHHTNIQGVLVRQIIKAIIRSRREMKTIFLYNLLKNLVDNWFYFSINYDTNYRLNK